MNPHTVLLIKDDDHMWGNLLSKQVLPVNGGDNCLHGI